MELPALGHDYQDKTVPRSCTKDGYTLHTCARCAYSYKDAIRSHRGHWYGEWFPTRVKHHTAFCRYDGCGEERETSCERITLSAGEATTAKLCPVCGGACGSSACRLR